MIGGKGWWVGGRCLEATVVWLPQCFRVVLDQRCHNYSSNIKTVWDTAASTGTAVHCSASTHGKGRDTGASLIVVQPNGIGNRILIPMDMKLYTSQYLHILFRVGHGNKTQLSYRKEPSHGFSPSYQVTPLLIDLTDWLVSSGLLNRECFRSNIIFWIGPGPSWILERLAAHQNWTTLETLSNVRCPSPIS